MVKIPEFDINQYDRVISKVVFAEGGGITCQNNHRCCAERRLLNLLEYEAKSHGYKGTKKKKWIHQQTNGFITIYRYKANGELGTSIPCLICAKSLKNYNLKVRCYIEGYGWFCDTMDCDHAPESKLTTAQRLYFSKEAKFPVNLNFHKL